MIPASAWGAGVRGSMIGCIVLAAGKSERMGRPKPLLPCRGSTFLGTVLDTLERTRVSAVRVVLGYGAAGVRSGCALPDGIVAVNPTPERGMLSSVRSGLASLPPGLDGFLLWPVDHPLVEPATVDLLIAAFEASGAPLAIPVHGGRRGHPALFAMRLAAELESAPDGEGARAVVRAHASDLVEVPVEDAGVLTGIDTPASYAAAFGQPLVEE
jgi:molybdenum cofactor cytidylyltransferase